MYLKNRSILLIYCVLSIKSFYAKTSIPDHMLIGRTKVLASGKYFIGSLRNNSSPMLYDKPIYEFPIIPFKAWGIRFDRNIIIALKDDSDWGMIEISKIILPNQEVIWFALDSKLNGEQFIGVNPENDKALDLALSFPAKTVYETNLTVKEQINPITNQGYYKVNYTRMDGRQINFELSADMTYSPPLLRNGNAMNHAKDRALALIDVFSLNLVGDTFRWLYPKNQQPLQIKSFMFRKIVGIMSQSAVGIAADEWHQRLIDGKIVLTRFNSSVENTKRSRTGNIDTFNSIEKVYEGKRVYSLVSSGLPEISYNFEVINKFESNHYELRDITINQASTSAGRIPLETDEVGKIIFNPSLPDLRYGPPLENVESKMAISINGRGGYQKGKVVLSQSGLLNTKIEIESIAPIWAKNRPMVTYIYNAFRNPPVSGYARNPFKKIFVKSVMSAHGEH